MNWVRDLPDDQLALLGCGCAILASALIMTISYYIGRDRRGVTVQTSTVRATRATNTPATPATATLANSSSRNKAA